MNPASYFDLLRLTLPEILVALSGLVALTLDLTVMQRRALSARWRMGALIACCRLRGRDSIASAAARTCQPV